MLRPPEMPVPAQPVSWTRVTLEFLWMPLTKSCGEGLVPVQKIIGEGEDTGHPLSCGLWSLILLTKLTIELQLRMAPVPFLVQKIAQLPQFLHFVMRGVQQLVTFFACREGLLHS